MTTEGQKAVQVVTANGSSVTVAESTGWDAAEDGSLHVFGDDDRMLAQFAAREWSYVAVAYI